MIEAHFTPVLDAVAGFAARTVALGVYILNAVARHARLTQILVNLTGMAGPASHFAMSALQRKVCGAMVEGLRSLPRRLVVAIGAFVA